MSLVWFEELIHLLVLFFEFVGGLLIIYGGIVATAIQIKSCSIWPAC